MKKVITIIVLALILSSCGLTANNMAPGMIVTGHEWNFSSGYHLIIMVLDSTTYYLPVSKKDYRNILDGDTLGDK